MPHPIAREKRRKRAQKATITDMATKTVRIMVSSDPVTAILESGEGDIVASKLDDTFDMARELSPDEFKQRFDRAVRSHTRVSFRQRRKKEKGR